MKHFVTLSIGIVLFLLFGIFIISQLRQKIDQALSRQHVVNAPTPTPRQPAEKTETQKTYLFVPYWSLTNTEIIESDQQILVYFGVAADEAGLRRNEDGYKKLLAFSESAGDKDKLLTIRMLDSDANFTILKNKIMQQKIIDQSIELAKRDGYGGIVMNLELSALPFESLTKQISEFNDLFYQQVKEESLQYFVTTYGDSFYRVRPFDIKQLSRNSDGIFIMAYDFHKARGNPGPNFPSNNCNFF